MKLLIRSGVTAVLLVALIVVWTRPIDVEGVIGKWLPIPLKKEFRLDIEIEKVSAAQFRGHPCLLFYPLHFANTSQENVTLKDITLRYTDSLGAHDIKSISVSTGEVETPGGEKRETLLVQVARSHETNNLFLMDWKNLQPIIGEYKTLPQGAVLTGSAAFVFPDVTIDQFKQLKAVELVATDFAGNRAVDTIEIQPLWIEQLKTWTLVERKFKKRGDNPIEWK